MNTRRGFFSTLLAAVAARFAPARQLSPSAAEMQRAYEECVRGAHYPPVMFYIAPDGVYQFNGREYRKISDHELDDEQVLYGSNFPEVA